MSSQVIDPVATSKLPPNPCWIIRNPLESVSLRVEEGLLVFSSYEGGMKYAQLANLQTCSVDRWLWNDLVEKGRTHYQTAVIDFDEGVPIVTLPMEKIAGWPSTPQKEVKVWTPGTPLLVETKTVNVSGYDLFNILECFPIVRKPRSQWLTDDPDEIQNHEWQGVSGEAFGRFHYQAWGTFRVQFMQGMGKIERGVPSAVLRIHELTRDALLKEIALALGVQVETKMGQILKLVCQQPNGEPGALDTKSQNIFFVRSASKAEPQKGELVAVRVYWDDSHGCPNRWWFDEFIITNIHPWNSGTKVFST